MAGWAGSGSSATSSRDAATPLSLVSTTSYDNTWADGWPFFRIASVFGTGFLPHRATTLGLPGLVAAVLLVVTCLDRRPAGVLLAGILAALLAPFQFFAFPATYLIVGAVRRRPAERGGRRRSSATPSCSSRRSCSRRRSSSMPSLAQGDVGAFKLVAGWASAPLSDGPAAVAFFYLTNLGIPFVLALIAGLTARHLRARAFLLTWLLALFIVPNVIRVSAVDFDMNKYFQIMWIAVAILAGVGHPALAEDRSSRLSSSCRRSRRRSSRSGTSGRTPSR